jgi:hypothetical protein
MASQSSKTDVVVVIVTSFDTVTPYDVHVWHNDAGAVVHVFSDGSEEYVGISLCPILFYN